MEAEGTSRIPERQDINIVGYNSLWVIIMSSTTTIQIPKKVKKDLDSFKEYPRETYADVIERLLALVKADEESELELSEETLKDIAEAEEDIRKGRVFSSEQIKKELGF